jgi:hypothetical protein
MISIEGLLEDEQGLSMGELLTVKIRQPSHEFTFGVGCWRWISVNLEYSLYIGFDYDLQLTHH